MSSGLVAGMRMGWTASGWAGSGFLVAISPVIHAAFQS